jgi:hypothetical protein
VKLDHAVTIHAPCAALEYDFSTSRYFLLHDICAAL